MKALISGRAGVALIVDGQTLQSVDIKNSLRPVERNLGEVPFLFGDARDIQIVESGNLESISEQLREESRFTVGLDLVLIGLDSELARDIRHDALFELDKVLRDQSIAERLKNVLYAEPIPEGGDLRGALAMTAGNLWKQAHELLGSLREAQPAIAAVANAWQAIPTKTFGGSEARVEFRHAAIRLGLFHIIALGATMTDHSTRVFESIVARHIPNLAHWDLVMQQWALALGRRDTPLPDGQARLEDSEHEHIVEILKRLRRRKKAKAKKDEVTLRHEEHTH